MTEFFRLGVADVCLVINFAQNITNESIAIRSFLALIISYSNHILSIVWIRYREILEM